MPRYAVVLIGTNGPLGGRDSLRLVDADTPVHAVKQAHPKPPNDQVRHAWVHQVEGTATVVEVVVDDPRWGKAQEGLAS